MTKYVVLCVGPSRPETPGVMVSVRQPGVFESRDEAVYAVAYDRKKGVTSYICETTPGSYPLKKRYGDRFTSERALNRDLDAERKVLEGGDDA